MKTLYKKLFFIVTVLFVGSILPVQQAQAYSLGVYGPSGEYIIATVSLNKSEYAPGEQVRATGISIKSMSPIIGQVSLNGGVNGGSASLLSTNISNGQTVTNPTSVGIGNAPSSGGAYDANFTASLYTNPMIVDAFAGEDGVGNASSTSCLVWMQIRDGTMVPGYQNQTIEAIVEVYGNPPPSNYGSNVPMALGTVLLMIPPWSTQSQVMSTADGGQMYPGVPAWAPNGFFCSPGQNYQANVLDYWPTTTNGRDIIVVGN